MEHPDKFTQEPETGTGHPAMDPRLIYGLRKIIHVDMDAYYASIEILDRPELKDLPIVVGGSPNSRGVVCTANYVARKFGIRSAMACSVAARLCPQAVFLKPRFDRYQELSQRIRSVFHQYTELVEPLSLDEAYLDVTADKERRYATQIAKQIRQQVFEATGLSCSAGVAPNKLVAKIASDFKKPNGLTVVIPEHVFAFMQPLSVRKIHGIGPAAENRLQQIGIRTCADVLRTNPQIIEDAMGRWGEWLILAAQGIDHRPVVTEWERKSYGREETFGQDVLSLEKLEAELAALTREVSEELKVAELKARTVTLKLKYHNFETITRSQTQAAPTDDEESILKVLRHLLCTKTEAGKRPVRLIGLSVSKF